MVIISASICDKNGKILIARQFQNISKLNLEEIIRNFPKLIQQNQQHTYIETHSERYVYLPIENLYLLLITNKNSNIIEDLETIRLLHKLIIDQCPHEQNEENIQKHGYEIFLAIDDVISLGYREGVTISQVQSSLEMESSEEKLHNMLMKARENEAKEQAKRHMQMVEKQQSEMKAMAKKGGASSYQSFDSSASFAKTVIEDSNMQNAVNSYEQSKNNKSTFPSSTPSSTAGPKNGMQLKKKAATTTTTGQQPAQQTADQRVPATSKSNDLSTQLLQEAQQQIQQQMHKVNPLQTPLEIESKEKFQCSLNRDGGLQNFEIVGEIFLVFHDPAKTNAQIKLQLQNSSNSLQLKPHPLLNRQLWQSQNILAAKDASFPANTPISTIKYKYTTSNINEVPFQFTYWLNDGSLTMEVEFSSSQSAFESLEDVRFVIRNIGNSKANVSSQENSDYQFESNNLVWLIPKLDGNNNQTANIEIKFDKGVSAENIFPIDVEFNQDYNFYQIQPVEARNQSDNSLINFEFKRSIQADKFKII